MNEDVTPHLQVGEVLRLPVQRIVVLLAKMFFCTITRPNPQESFPGHYAPMFSSRLPSALCYLRVLHDYLTWAVLHFESLAEDMVRFELCTIPTIQFNCSGEAVSPLEEAAWWTASEAQLCPFSVSPPGLIAPRPPHDPRSSCAYSSTRIVEVDFASAVPGPGPAGTMEEILMGTSPELAVLALLLPHPLGPHETVRVEGALPFGHIVKRGDSITFVGSLLRDEVGPTHAYSNGTPSPAPHDAPTSLDCCTGGATGSRPLLPFRHLSPLAARHPRVGRVVAVMDALPVDELLEAERLRKPRPLRGSGDGELMLVQLKKRHLLRELIKATCGLAPSASRSVTTAAATAAPTPNNSSEETVLTGAWGCGAYCGDPAIKALVQWMALSAALIVGGGVGGPLSKLVYCGGGSNAEFCMALDAFVKSCSPSAAAAGVHVPRVGDIWALLRLFRAMKKKGTDGEIDAPLFGVFPTWPVACASLAAARTAM